MVTTNPASPNLSAAEVRRLNFWKWRYSLEQRWGFSTEQATRLLFYRWLHQRGRLSEF